MIQPAFSAQQTIPWHNAPIHKIQRMNDGTVQFWILVRSLTRAFFSSSDKPYSESFSETSSMLQLTMVQENRNIHALDKRSATSSIITQMGPLLSSSSSVATIFSSAPEVVTAQNLCRKYSNLGRNKISFLWLFWVMCIFWAFLAMVLLAVGRDLKSVMTMESSSSDSSPLTHASALSQVKPMRVSLYAIQATYKK